MQPMISPIETLTLAQAAKICGVTRVTMWRWVKANDLPATTTLGGHHRIRKSDLSVFLQKNTFAVDGKDQGIRILIVDDDPSIQKLISRTLERCGYMVETCANGFEAGIAVMRFRPHLIILDLFMPYLDGFQVCGLLKKDAETAGIKIIAISGHSSDANIERVLECGADIFLRKPLSKTILIEQIESLLRQSVAV
jgi:excisionase family DNA binding protein